MKNFYLLIYTLLLCILGSYAQTPDSCRIVTLPYTENFDSCCVSGSGVFPSCYTHSGTVSLYCSSPYYSAPASLYFYSTSSTYCIVALPEIDSSIPVSSLEAIFRLYKPDITGELQIGIMTDPLADSTFTLITTLSPSYNWEEFEVSFNSYTGTGQYIVFKSDRRAASTSNYMCLDNITIDYIPTCIKPINLAINNIGRNSVDITWHASGNESAWDVVCVPYGNDPSTGVITTVYDTATTIIGLTSNTHYDIYVRANCGNETSRWSDVEDFWTLCDAITVFPYTENFDSYGTGTSAFPNCWTKLTTYNSYPYLYASYYYSSPASLYFYSTSSTYCIALLPQIDSSISINTLQAGFKLYTTLIGSELQIGVMTDPLVDSTFTLITTLTPSTTDAWEDFDVPFNTYTGTGQYIAFKSDRRTASSRNKMYLDDVMIDYIPVCIRPDSLVCSNVSGNSVDIGWQERGSATSWNIEYGPSGYTLGTGTLLTGVLNPYILSGLNPSTTYDVYVQSNCSFGGTSTWSNISFMTNQIAINVPFTIDFEDSLENANWSLINGSCANKWVIGTALNNTISGTKALYISDNEGVSNSYSNWASIVWAYRDIYFTPTIGEYQLSFDWKANGDGTTSYDYIRVYIGDPAVVTANTTSLTAPANSVILENSLFLSSTWVSATVTLDTSYSGTIKRLYFAWINNTDNSIDPPGAIDNISLVANVCVTPSNLAVSNITAVAADLNWTIGRGETNWDIEYGANGFTHGSGISISVTDTFWTISGLTDVTGYDVYVRANCENGDVSSWFGPVSFTTSCLPDTIPESENFDSYPDWYSPDCWRKFESPSITGYAYIYPTYSYSSPKSLKIGTRSGSTSYYGFIRTNQLNIADFSNVQLSFKGKKSSGVTKPLVVGIMSDATDISTIAILDTIENMTSAWSDYTIFLSSYTDTGKYVVIGVPAGIDEACDYWVDDLSIDYIPSCIRPINLSVTNITANSADLNWTELGAATTWYIEYDLTGFTQGTGNLISTTNNPYAITGLVNSTVYQVYVRSDCNNGDFSTWIGPVTFTTRDICEVPTNLTVSGITENSADVSWSAGGSETLWTLEYKTFSSANYNSVNCSNNSYTLTGLSPLSDYVVRVKAICGTGNESDYISANFTTDSAQVITYTITASAGDNGTISPSGTISIPQGGSQTFTISPDNGYNIQDVLVDNVSQGDTSSYTFSNVQGNHVISVSFSAQEITYTITASAGDNGTISPSGTISIPQGGNQTFTISPDNGYNIQDVLVDNVSQGDTSSYTFSNVQENHAISVSFSAQEITYTITASAGDNGTISPSGTISIPQGGSQTFTISPDNGYNIQDVLVDNVSQGDTSSYTFSNIQENHAISVSFSAQEITYTITASAGDNGTISPSGTISIPQGGSQTFTISPDNGYHIQNVLVDNVSQGDASSYTFSNIQENHAISVSFIAGIEDNVLGTDVLIFPNPANNVLNIKSRQLFEKIKITNLLGQVLYNAKITNSDFSINISSYTAGIYFVCLEGKNGIATKKFVIE